MFFRSAFELDHTFHPPTSGAVDKNKPLAGFFQGTLFFIHKGRVKYPLCTFSSIQKWSFVNIRVKREKSIMNGPR